jgi:hypothetical protein
MYVADPLVQCDMLTPAKQEDIMVKSDTSWFVCRHIPLAVILTTASIVLLAAPTPGLAAVTREEVETALSPIASNTILGNEALISRTTAKEDLAFGSSALTALTEGTGDIAVGPSALASLAGKTSKDVAIGVSAMKGTTTGENNVAVGDTALSADTTGKFNTAVGNSALATLTEGEENIAVGPFALTSLTGKASKDVAIGASAMKEATGENNVAVGNTALLSDTTGVENTAVGNSAAAKNTAGERNTAIGREALAEGTTGIKNTGVGFNALNENQTGSENTAIGVDSLGKPSIAHASISRDTAVGFNAGLGAEGDGDVFLGWEAGAAIKKVSNVLYIDNSQTEAPLIFGNFETNVLTVNGKLEVSETAPAPTKPAEGETNTGTAKIASRKTSFTITGNGVKAKWSLKHSLATRLVNVYVQKAESEQPGELELLTAYKAKPTSNAEVEVTFSIAPAAGEEKFITVVG